MGTTPLLGPTDALHFLPGSPEYYVHVYGVTIAEAEAYVGTLPPKLQREYDAYVASVKSSAPKRG